MGKNSGASKRDQATFEEDMPRVAQNMSAEHLDKLRRETERRIDAFMKKVGYADPSKRTDEQGWRWFDYGTARGRAGIVVSDPGEEMFLRIESMVMELPTDQEELSAMMRELLETNMSIAGPARLAINGDGVFVCATVPVVDLRSGDVPTHIHSVMAIAESFNSSVLQQVEQEQAIDQGVPTENPAERLSDE